MRQSAPNHRDFSLLFVGQLVSQFGDSIFHIGLLWLALDLTGSKSTSSIIVAAGYLPAILFALVAGVIADRVDRRRLMIVCAGLQAAVVATVPLLASANMLNGWFLALVAFGLASGAAFFNPARDALVPHLVSKDRLTWANSLVKVSAQLAFLAGPLAAGLLVAWVGTLHLFTVDSVTFLIGVITLSLMRVSKTKTPDPQVEPAPLPQVPAATGGTAKEVMAGLRHAWGDSRLRQLLVVTSIDNMIIMGPAILGLPIYVKETLGLGEDGLVAYSFLTGVLFIGMLSASLWLGWRGKKLPRGKTILIGIMLDGLTFIPFYFIRWFPLACAAMLVHGLTVPLILVPRTTLIQEIVPDKKRGRIFALLNLAVIGCTVVSMLLTGILSEHFGMDVIYLGTGIAGTLCGIISIRCRELWRS